MDLTFEQIRELSALGAVLFVFLSVFTVAVWRGIPALIAYLDRKDERHRNDIMNLIASSREERDTFYANLGIKLDRIHDELHKIKSSVILPKQEKTP